LSFEGNGYNDETAAATDCIPAGRLESDVIPLDELLQLLEAMDPIRAQWELKYSMA
jgi:dihydrodiol dehydrogenase / D-xylose 1-dehydrogenase (NADP)